MKKLRLARETLKNLSIAGRAAGMANTADCSLNCPTGPAVCGPDSGFRGECFTSREDTCNFGGPSEAGCNSGYTCGPCVGLTIACWG